MRNTGICDGEDACTPASYVVSCALGRLLCLHFNQVMVVLTANVFFSKYKIDFMMYSLAEVLPMAMHTAPVFFLKNLHLSGVQGKRQCCSYQHDPLWRLIWLQTCQEHVGQQEWHALNHRTYRCQQDFVSAGDSLPDMIMLFLPSKFMCVPVRKWYNLIKSNWKLVTVMKAMPLCVYRNKQSSWEQVFGMHSH